MTTREDAERFLGKRVQAVLDTGEDRQPVVIVGQLIAVGDMGSFVIKDDADEIMHCWPLLHLREV